MSKRDWKKELQWSDEQIEEMRNIAFSYIRQGKYDIALPMFNALTVLDPNSVYDFQLLGAIYVEINQPKNAIRYLNKALQLQGDHGPTLLNLMKAFFMSKRIEDGLRLANVLQNDKDIFISSAAKALTLCYKPNEESTKVESKIDARVNLLRPGEKNKK